MDSRARVGAASCRAERRDPQTTWPDVCLCTGETLFAVFCCVFVCVCLCCTTFCAVAVCAMAQHHMRSNEVVGRVWQS